VNLTGEPHVRTGGIVAPRPPLPRPWALAIIIVTLVLVFLLDQATGSAPVQHLYYLPIILAALWFGRAGGLAAAVSAVALYHLANPVLLTSHYKETDLVQIALFVAVGLVTARLGSDARRLRALAMTDDLTGLHNLRSFERELPVMIRSTHETGSSLSLLVLDVDRLKSLNDQHGHLTGAEAVRIVGHTIGAHLPPGAIACRYGGDEFVVALPGHDGRGAAAVADQLRRAVNALEPVLAGVRFAPATLSISVGLACLPAEGSGSARARPERDAGEALFRAADQALYAAKHAGRNRVSSALGETPGPHDAR
jgi:diguanylate cyclase (GGDEF)-like protein